MQVRERKTGTKPTDDPIKIEQMKCKPTGDYELESC